MKLFLIFSADWCAPCNQMKSTWADAKVKAALEQFINYHINVDKERNAANENGIRTIPTYGIYDVSSGRPKAVKVASGYKDVGELLKWLGK